MINTNVFEFKKGNISGESTELFFVGPYDMVKDEYPDADSAEISIEFPKMMPLGAYAVVNMSPAKDGIADDWADAQNLFTDEDLDELIHIGLEKM
jgi:hypothetical protein